MLSVTDYMPDSLVELLSSYADSCMSPFPEEGGRFEEFDSDRDMAEVLRALEEEGYEFSAGKGFLDNGSDALGTSVVDTVGTGLQSGYSGWNMPGLVIQDDRIYAIGEGDYKTLERTVEETL